MQSRPFFPVLTIKTNATLPYISIVSIILKVVLLATFYVAIVVPFNASFSTLSDDDAAQHLQRSSVPADVVVEAIFIFGKSPSLHSLTYKPAFNTAKNHLNNCRIWLYKS